MRIFSLSLFLFNSLSLFLSFRSFLLSLAFSASRLLRQLERERGREEKTAVGNSFFVFFHPLSFFLVSFKKKKTSTSSDQLLSFRGPSKGAIFYFFSSERHGCENEIKMPALAIRAPLAAFRVPSKPERLDFFFALSANSDRRRRSGHSPPGATSASVWGLFGISLWRIVRYVNEIATSKVIKIKKDGSGKILALFDRSKKIKARKKGGRVEEGALSKLSFAPPSPPPL